MVSFFGIKFGSKKSQQKQSQDQSSTKWKNGDPASFADAHPGYNFSRPQRPLSRPGTSYSSQNTMSFRAPFASNPEASSSMVELAPPSARRPSVSSLRAISSNPTLKGGRPNISGPIGPPVPLPLSQEGSRPGTPTRPGTAGSLKKDWVNPLDVHFSRDRSSTMSSSPSKTATPTFSRSPLAQTDLGLGTNHKRIDNSLDGVMGPTGYPSPPQSIKSSDQISTSNSTESKTLSQTNRPVEPSGLRRVNTAEETRIPSPATSDDRGEGLMIRNVNAKRDTLAFHAPRRAEESTARKTWKEKTDEEREAIKKRRQTEGFEGNFSAFNFGGAPIDTSFPMPSASPESTFYRPGSPADSRGSHSPLEKRTTGDSAHTQSTLSRETTGNERVAVKPLDPWTDALPRIPVKGHSKQVPSEVSSQQSYGTTASMVESPPSRPVHARGDSDTRAPGTPTALRAPPTIAEYFPISNAQSQRGRTVEKMNAPPKLDPDRRSQSPLRSRGPIEGDFPLSNGLPRGRRPAPAPISVPSPAGGGLKPPSRPPREDEKSGSLPTWADRAERHLSALPAPLTPLGASPNPMADKDLTPWAATTTPTSPIAPRLPSPTFSSLEKSTSSGGNDFGKSFEMSFEEEIANSLGHHMFSDLSSPTDPSIKVEKKAAPPRPPYTTLPPGNSGTSRTGTPTGSIKSPIRAEFTPSFI